MEFSQSKKWHTRGMKVIPLATQTLSKSTSQFTQPSPIYVQRGHGPFLYDVDGNRWVDYIAALGPVVLGYGNKQVNSALEKQLKEGTSFSLSHPLEVEVAEAICKQIPWVEQVRFGKNGSDVTTAAVRAARALTQREHIVLCGYHGWHDWSIGTTSKNAGVPQAVQKLSHTFNYNDAESLEKLFESHPNQIAAVIMESVGITEPKDGFLKKVKELTHKHGAILIFDEVINGFRLAPGGGAQHFDVFPDFVTLGKAMGNGVPISAIAGKRDFMKAFDEIFFSFTFGGDTLGLAAAKTTLQIMEERNGYQYLWELGKDLKNGISKLIHEYGLDSHIKCIGLPHHFVVAFQDDEEQLKKSFFQQESIKRGILFLGPHFQSLSHSELITMKSLKIYEEVIAEFQKALSDNQFSDRLEGDPVKPVFRKRI